MKNLILISILALLWSINTNAQCCPSKETQSNATESSIHKVNEVKLKITGLTCAGCSIALQKELKNLNGVIENNIKYPGDIAIIKYDPLKTTINTLKKVFENKGFIAEEVK